MRLWPIRFYKMFKLGSRLDFAVQDGSDGRRGLYIRIWRIAARVGFAFDWKYADGTPHGVINWTDR